MLNKKFLKFLAVWTILAAAIDTLGAQAVELTAVADTNRTIILWTYNREFTGYNIYRKTVGGAYQRLNARPIQIVTNCAELRRIIPDHSFEESVITSLIGGGVCELPAAMRNDTIAMAVRGYAYIYPRIAVAIGQGYLDSSITYGVTYVYAITGISASGESEILDTAVVVAGVVVPPSPPTGVEALPGEASVMVRWNPDSNAVGYIVERRDPGSASFQRVNVSIVMNRCKVDPHGDSLSDTTKLCFTDYMRWSDGEPDSHYVVDHWVNGPFPGKTYFYRVRAISLTWLQSAPSAVVSATPYDSTPPAAPVNINVATIGESLAVSWDKVTKDVRGHKDSVIGYQVYRYLTAEDTLGTYLGFAPHPTSDSVLTVSFLDNSPGLGSPYEDRRYYYRIRAVDAYGNKSELSAPIYGIVPDVTPPKPPTDLEARGYEHYIELHWKKPNSPDVAGYQIYRGICGDTLIRQLERRVPYPMYLIGAVDDPDSTVFFDRTVPEGSPLCYRYAVKAYDRSQNLSDTSRTVCQKLRERTPPEPPIIVGLKARDGGILVQWVTPPVQDLFGFVVERAPASDTTSWVRVGPELKFPDAPVCESIPATNIWAQDSVFSFLDTTADPKVTYFYRVRGADYGGNIGEPSTPIATYTFGFEGPPRPHITSITPVAGGLQITWTPPYSSDYLGFIVFRSNDLNGNYLQISPIITGNSFIDKNVRSGATFWYKVQCIGVDGNRSEPSTPSSGGLP